MTRLIALVFTIFTIAVPTMLADESDVADASTQPVLVELFANQNCPACPRAHKTMREITAAQKDVLVLTWVVDYWDYLGDPDPMALPEAKARHGSYADWLTLRAPYTPQTIYNGVKECPGPRRKRVLKNIEALSSKPISAIQLVEKEGRVSAIGPLSGNEMFYTVRYMKAAENETGMVNPVTSISPLEGFQNVAHGCDQDCAVLLQSVQTGEVIAFWQAD
ncbi:MAG: DUF1223 domain-containing protein [Pseudomonadota bacterium]